MVLGQGGPPRQDAWAGRVQSAGAKLVPWSSGGHRPGHTQSSQPCLMSWGLQRSSLSWKLAGRPAPG